MGLHGKKNLKTTIQKIMKISEICKEINCGGVSLESNYFFFQFTATLLMIIWKIHIQSPVKQLLWSFYVENLLTYYSS